MASYERLRNCKCNPPVTATLSQSKKGDNPGMWFFGCPRWTPEGGGCKFFAKFPGTPDPQTIEMYAEAKARFNDSKKREYSNSNDSYDQDPRQTRMKISPPASNRNDDGWQPTDHFQQQQQQQRRNEPEQDPRMDKMELKLMAIETLLRDMDTTMGNNHVELANWNNAILKQLVIIGKSQQVKPLPPPRDDDNNDSNYTRLD